MRMFFFILLLSSPYLARAQSDSMMVELMNGELRVYALPSIDKLTFSGLPTSIREQTLVESLLSSFTLHQNFPNPFNPSTIIEYEVPHSGLVLVGIFNIQGRLVRVLLNTQLNAGTHQVAWDGRNNNGTIVSAGPYFVRVTFNRNVRTKKILLIK